MMWDKGKDRGMPAEVLSPLDMIRTWACWDLKTVIHINCKCFIEYVSNFYHQIFVIMLVILWVS